MYSTLYSVQYPFYMVWTRRVSPLPPPAVWTCRVSPLPKPALMDVRSVYVSLFLNAGMPDSPSSGQSSTGMNKNADAGTNPVSQ